MHYPQRREESRYIHIDTSVFDENAEKNKYKIRFNTNGKNSTEDINFHMIPIQDYNNVIKLELKFFKFKNDLSANYEYIFLKLKNVDGKVDSSTSCQDSTAVIYFDGKKPTLFEDYEFRFNPPISRLTELSVELRDNDNNLITPPDDDTTVDHSFLLKVTYIEGNIY